MSAPNENVTEAPSERSGESAIGSRAAWLALLAVTLGGLAVDLLSKSIAFAKIAPHPVIVDRAKVLDAQARGLSLSRLIPDDMTPRHIIPNVLDLSLVLNPGAVFGIGAGKRWFFVAFTAGAMALAVWMFGAWTRAKDRWAHIGIGLLVAGGIGNLYDRLVYGCVRDFIHPLPGVQLPFGWTMPLSGGREVWPYVSNIADLWLLIGIGMLMWYLWRQGAHKKIAHRDKPPAA
jgi:signal peptidase II